MTTVFLLATTPADSGGPAALLCAAGKPLVARLAGQFAMHDVSDIHVVTRPEWEVDVEAAVRAFDATVRTASAPADVLDTIATTAERAHGTLVITHADIVTHDSVVTRLLRDPSVPTGVLMSSRMRTSWMPRLRTERGRVVACASAYHGVARPNGVLLGMLKVAGPDASRLADVARELADLTRGPLPPLWEEELRAKVRAWGEQFFSTQARTLALAAHLEHADEKQPWLPDPAVLEGDVQQRFLTAVVTPGTAASEDVVALLTTGLCRAGHVLTGSYLRNFFLARPLSEEAAKGAERALAVVPEDKLLLDAAVKHSDGFFTTFFVSPYSRYLARWCARRGLTPNQVTTASMALGVLAAASFATGARAGMVAGAILLQLAFTTDCVDGQLARYTTQFSRLGAWLDSVFDRGKEYLVFAGLALGAMRLGDDGSVWLLASAALALQTARHALDFSFAATIHANIAEAVVAPLAEPDEPTPPPVEARETAAKVDASDVAEVPKVQGPFATIASAVIRASRKVERFRATKWAKRIMVLPIGERFALISVTAIVGGPRMVFIVLLSWGTLAFAYTVMGRIFRSVVA